MAQTRELARGGGWLDFAGAGLLALAGGTLLAWAVMGWAQTSGSGRRIQNLVMAAAGLAIVAVLEFGGGETGLGSAGEEGGVLRVGVGLLALAGVVWFIKRRGAAAVSPLETAAADSASPTTARLTPGFETLARDYMDNIPLPGWIVDTGGVYRFANDAFVANLKLNAAPVGRSLAEIHPAETAREYAAVNARVLAENRLIEADHHTQAGSIHVYMFPLHGENGERLVGGLGVDITERQRVTGLLREQGELLTAVTDAMHRYLQTGDWRASHEILLRGAIQQTHSVRGFVGVMVSEQRLRILAEIDMPWASVVGEDEWKRASSHLAERGWLEFAACERLTGRVLTSGGVVIANSPIEPAPPLASDLLVVPVLHAQQTIGLIGVGGRANAYDSDARGRLETLVQQAGVLSDCYRRSLREVSLEEQVRVAQKMEAVGLLAGGVAHDFNNLLQVIQGYTSMALDSGTAWPDRKASLDQVKAAADRAAQLTRQLLAFGRQQTLQKTDLNLNQAIAELLKMLRRVIGEQIAIDFIPGHELGNVLADRAQIDQVLLNLCVNARDAIPAGGRISLETENVLVNGAFRESHPWAKPGRYVLVTVTDDGTGMDRETLSHVFEPFFTTKPKGKGTGLGLAVVYGVIKQHDGMVHVYSEPGKGTTFKIYLPIVTRAAATVGPKHTPAPSRGSETILLAEDEPMVRELALRILQRSGYKVVVAVDGADACVQFEAHQSEIALLLLDVVMPNLGGRDACERIGKIRPGLPVIFCSGYAGSALDASVLSLPGTHVLAKPYGADELLHRVRAALDGKEATGK